ncbi:serine/threonine-protein kinase STY13-like isoform X2 [Punica granatum]|uniref:Serine/threonine-protein kinase STY13-like isoform X2 n=1 Tax=Punica granatum TaxID=22663 RepID=A0A6P8EHP5_PUNGR|nr:serine/threonine-protein kinase STY13-like isoform X2 [Punica granatum]
MESGCRIYSDDEFRLDSKWLIDPQHLFVGPKLGEGAHAKVYEGKYKNQTVAIKIVHKGETPEDIAKIEARFAREVAMLSRVQHKNLVKFIGACKEPVMVIVTELLSGDQKTVKLADFGLAREESLTEMMTAETGTYRWMAPELYSTVTLRQGEKKHYNHKVDAYSFAIVLWELLHNKLPFEGMSNLQAAYAAAFKNVRPSADNLPEELAIILTSCWKEDPNDRPNFSQIIQMLLNYLYTIAPPESAIPSRIFTSENRVLAPESPGTSSLMARCDATEETQGKSKGFFSCFDQCY